MPFFGKIVLFFKILQIVRITTFHEGTLDPRQSKNDACRVVVDFENAYTLDGSLTDGRPRRTLQR